MKESPFVERLIDKYIKNEELKRLLITHSRCVGMKALRVAEACGLNIDRQKLYDAAMLHDIGIVRCSAPGIYCYGTEPYICHGIIGAEMLREERIGEEYARVCERHTGSGLTAGEIAAARLPLPHKDFLPESELEKLICYADKFYSKSSDPEREKSVEQVIDSMARHGEAPLIRFLELHEAFGLRPKTEDRSKK